MARGTGRFSPEVLRKLRSTRPVEGRLLSAAALAELVGTSKARILAYENGRSVPEPSRIFELAAVFGVNPRELYKPAKGWVSLRDMRGYAGLTAAEVAEQCGVSRSTYRGIEQSAIVPPRYTSTLPMRLADVLGHPLRMIEKALEQHPATQERRSAIGDLLTPLYGRAHIRHSPAAVSAEEPELVAIAELLRRPPSVVCRLVNYEMNRLRSLLLQRGVASQNLAYAQTPRAAHVAERHIAQLDSAIDRFPQASASALDHFTAWALTCAEWRALVSLFDVSYAYVADELIDLDERMVLNSLVTRGLVATDRDRSVEANAYVVTTRGAQMIRLQQERYACLYPRVPSPRPPAARTRPGNEPIRVRKLGVA